ncbi:MAG: BamA/TamA family outer membrane protein [Candidatus Zixiibacteriota bacterium]|nr:MAG: BamA/TamA family outer membrane protein [candidate division Zixibacteria bacterium]
MTLLRKQAGMAVVLLIVGLCGSGLPSDFVRQQPVAGDQVSFDGLEIDSVIIENRNIYDTDDDAYDRFIFRLANRLHIKTRRYIIQREVLLKRGDPFSHQLAEESSRNLRANLKIYDAWIETSLLPNGKLLMKVVTIDQWSLAGGLNYSREGNETKYQIGAEEENFLGNNQFISFYYFAQSDDDNFIETRFFDNRFLGQRYRLALDYGSDPLNSVRRMRLGRPLYDLEQEYSYFVDVAKFSGRRDVYSDSSKIGESFFDGDRVRSEVTYRTGAHDSKLLFRLRHAYRFEGISQRQIFSDDADDIDLALASFPDDSLYHQFDLENQYSRFRYITLENIDGFGYTEDFVLGTFIGAGYGRAFHSDFKGHQFDRVGAFVSHYRSHGPSLMLFDYSHEIWFRGETMLRHATSAAGRYYNRLSDRTTFALQARYSSDWRGSDQNSLLLGGTTGIRGYDKFFLTGDRRLVINVEARFFSDLTLLSAMFGAAAFVDLGNIWKPQERLDLSDFYASTGVGLRIAFAKSTKNIVRIDLAYSETTRWELSVGTDQYFFAQR